MRVSDFASKEHYCLCTLERYGWRIDEGADPIAIKSVVGAKHSGDNIRNSTKIFLTECFALPQRSQGEAFGNRDLGLPNR